MIYGSELDRAHYKADQTKMLNQLLALVYALLGLAIIIALLGIANTLALSIAERTREVGLLRAVGMTRSQLRSTIRWEAVIIALQGTLLGLLIGTFFGWALVAALHDPRLHRVPGASSQSDRRGGARSSRGRPCSCATEQTRSEARRPAAVVSD